MKKIFTFIQIVSLLLILLSCSEDPEIIPIQEEVDAGLIELSDVQENIPQWIYDEMSNFYFWNQGLPAVGPVGNENPSDYFNSLLDPNDRFSYISDDAESLKQENTGTILAMGFSPSYGFFTNSDNLFAIIEYVYPNSPADLAGLKRGDIIIQVDGENLNRSNFLRLGTNKGFSVTLGRYNDSGISPTSQTITIGSGVIELDPVIYKEIKLVNGIKTGYLVYIDFISGSNDKWLNSLNDAIATFKQENISELVLDLRYNPGGEVNVAGQLASALAPVSVVNNRDVLVKFMYNENLQNFFENRQGENSPNLVSRFRPNANNLNLNTLYVLTSGTTASASELVINGLRPYMNVVQIGEPTFGKFYGSFLLYDRNDPPKHNWAMAPVVLKYSNATGITDFVNGLLPDYFVDDNLLDAKPFGDEGDPMLALALALISGTDLSTSRISSGKPYQDVYDLFRFNRKNIFFSE